MALAVGVAAFVLLSQASKGEPDYLSEEAKDQRDQALKLLEYTPDADYEKASRLLYDAAEKGDLFAWMHWAYVQKQYHKDFYYEPPVGAARRGLSTVKELADNGNAEAAYLVAMFYAWYRPDVDRSEVRRYALLGADGGYVPAINAYGFDLKEAYYGDKDLAQAKLYLEKAAQAGDLGAMNQLADLLMQVDFAGHDFKAGFNWYLKSAEAGYKASHYGVGWCYSKGTGTRLDKQEALKWYERGASVNDPQSLFALGYKYANAEDVPEDLVKAREYFEKASAQGYEDATRWIEILDSGERK